MCYLNLFYFLYNKKLITLRSLAVKRRGGGTEREGGGLWGCLL
jgi:hypothetical protein